MKSQPAHKQGLIFDLDGTLVDTLADIATSINLTRARYDLPILPEREVTRHLGHGPEHLVRQTVPVSANLFPAADEAYAAYYLEHMLDQSRPHVGVAGILDRFDGRLLAVITNKPIFQTEKLLEGLSLRFRFNTVLGGDSLPAKKPDPLPLRHFMESNGLAPGEVVIIGDGKNDIRAGKAAGVTTVGVTFGVATRQELAAEAADFIIDSMAELAEIVC